MLLLTLRRSYAYWYTYLPARMGPGRRIARV